MPIYEFRCVECDEVSEEMLSFKDKTKTIKCPICNNKSERIMSLGSFHLKGSGWYKDGYGKRNTSKEEVAEKPKTESTTKEPPKAKPIADS
jgi:putative FmdB family regulatory protein|tara:strand:- start:201 stop:473 length:273 start_codon:yes stop_codon:yes gene_type:complete